MYVKFVIRDQTKFRQKRKCLKIRKNLGPQNRRIAAKNLLVTNNISMQLAEQSAFGNFFSASVPPVLHKSVNANFLFCTKGNK
jgi:hypothetical protein